MVKLDSSYQVGGASLFSLLRSNISVATGEGGGGVGDVESNNRKSASLSIVSDSSLLTDFDSTNRNQKQQQQRQQHNQGSSVLGAASNFTNSIVGAGCIGYGGAVADSGGLVSVLLIAVFALLCKASYDLLIDLGIEYNVKSYEALGFRAYGATGRMAVILSKVVFAFGGMVAFMVVTRDNFSPACVALLGEIAAQEEEGIGSNANPLVVLFASKVWMTVALCTFVMLPLSLLRDVSFLEKFSSAKITIFGGIVITVIYFYFTLPPSTEASSLTFGQKWFEVRTGVIKSTGTFIYGFVAQHTVHMVFRSLKKHSQNMEDFKIVSTISVGLAFTIFLSLGLFAYMTFWRETKSDLFYEYPSVPLVDWARILLSVAMLFSFPMNLFSLRELIVHSLPSSAPVAPEASGVRYEIPSDGVPTESDGLLGGHVIDFTRSCSREATDETEVAPVHLSWPHHAALTTSLWGASLFLAVSPASLGDVLNLIGCIAGALIAFVLPAAFAFRLRGYDHMIFLFFVTGCFVGCFGTYFGLKDMFTK